MSFHGFIDDRPARTVKSSRLNRKPRSAGFTTMLDNIYSDKQMRVAMIKARQNPGWAMQYLLGLYHASPIQMALAERAANGTLRLNPDAFPFASLRQGNS